MWTFRITNSFEWEIRVRSFIQCDQVGCDEIRILLSRFELDKMCIRPGEHKEPQGNVSEIKGLSSSV